jgi:hypothetical protein
VFPCVEFLDPYYDSVLRLERSPKTYLALGVLIFAAAARAERVATLEGTNMRATVTTGLAGLPLLRLFFFIEDGVLNIMHVEPYDEWEP